MESEINWVATFLSTLEKQKWMKNIYHTFVTTFFDGIRLFPSLFLSVVGVNFIYINKNLSIHQLLGSWKLQEITPILVKIWSKSTSIKYYFTLFCKVSSSSLVYKESAIFIFHNDSTRYMYMNRKFSFTQCTAYKQTPNNSVDWKMRLLRLKSFPMSFLRKSSLILEGNLNQLLIIIYLPTLNIHLWK